MANGWFVPPLTQGIAPNYHVEGCAVSATLVPGLRRDHGWKARFYKIKCGKDAVARRTFPAIRRAEGYTPISYAPAIVGYRIGRAIGGATGTSYGARILQFLTYIILMALAIRIVPMGKPLLFAAALLPVSLQGSVAISADPMTLALAFLSVAMALRLMVPRNDAPPHASNWYLLALGLVCFSLAISKIAYLPITGIVAAIPTISFGSVKRRVLWAGSIIGFGIVSTLAWSQLVISKLEMSTNSRLSSKQATKIITDDPIEFVRMIGRSWTSSDELNATIRGLVIPHYRLVHSRPTIAVWAVVIIIAVFVTVRLLDPAIRRLSRPEDSNMVAIRTGLDARIGWLVAIGSVAVFFAMTEVGLFVLGNSFGKYILGFQGRYLLPLLPLCLLSGYPRLSRWDHQLRVLLPVATAALLTWWCVTSWHAFTPT